MWIFVVLHLELKICQKRTQLESVREATFIIGGGAGEFRLIFLNVRPSPVFLILRL